MSNNNSIKLLNNYNKNDITNNSLKNYISVLIVGYFGVKILYGIFNNYTKKPMRDEMIDFSVMIVMGYILYILTNMENRNVISNLQNINWIFVLGYIVGLNIPFIYQQIKKDNNIINNKPIQYIFYSVFVIIILLMLFLSVKNSSNYSNPVFYILYLIVIAILIAGIIITRKKPRFFETTKFDKNLQNNISLLTKHFDNNELIAMIDNSEFREEAKKSHDLNDDKYIINFMKNNSQFKNIYNIYYNLPKSAQYDVINNLISLYKPVLQKGYLNERGTYITFGFAMIGWILSLLFIYDSEQNIIHNAMSIFNGLTIGIFVSGVSFYGFEYILKDQNELKCFGEDECRRNDMVLKNKEYENIAAGLSTVKWSLVFTIIILMLAMILFFVINNNS